MKYTRYIPVIIAFLTVLLWSATALAETEVLRYQRDASNTWETKPEEITGEDFESITYRGLGKQNRGDIIFVDYNTNIDFNRGEEQFERGEFRAAVQSYEKAMEGGKQFWIQSYAMFRIATCYWSMAQYDKAIEWFDKLLKEQPNSPFLGQASCDLAEVHIFMSAFDKAEPILKAVYSNRKLQICWIDRANYLFGRLQVAKKDFRTARSHINAVVRRMEYEDIKQNTRMLLGECLETEAEQNKKDPNTYKEAVRVYEEIAAELNVKTLGRAQANIARCLYNIKDFENAYWYGLRAGLGYLDLDNGLAAEGLYYAGKAMLALYNGEKDSEKKKSLGANIKLIRGIFERKLFGLPLTTKALNELK
jgi:tetratricopeptide (TPR) repeat protein